MDLDPIKTLVRQRTGLVFEDSRLAKLDDAVRNMMADKGLVAPVEFLDLLRKDHREFDNLVDLLTVNETYFFREPAHLRVLSERIVPRILKKKPGSRIRILSAGCSTGEEPYSCAMEVIEKVPGSAASLVDVLGVDIDGSAVAKAMKGIYGKPSFRGISPVLKEKYFSRIGEDRYVIGDRVRPMVRFRVHNLLNEVYPDMIRGMDVIFYRNVSIYFDSETQRKIFENLSRILNPGGYLFLSSTETLSHNVSILSLIEIDGSFLYRKEPAGSVHVEGDQKSGAFGRNTAPAALRRPFPYSGTAADYHPLPGGGRLEEILSAFPDLKFPQEEETIVPVLGPAVTPSPAPVPVSAGESRPDDVYTEALALAKAKEYEKSMRLIDGILALDSSYIRALTLKANLLVNLDSLEEARSISSKAVAMDQLCLEGYLLLGLIAKMKDDAEDSIRQFKMALYVRPSCWLAHLYLGEIYHFRSEREKADREYGIVKNLLEADGTSDPGLSFFPLSMPVEQILHLCRHRLAQMQK